MALPGIITIIALLALILSKKVSALSALILVPMIVALAAGFGMETFSFAVKGIRNIAPVAAMFIFAIIFFGVLTDAGMFDPIINGILRLVKNHPARITMGAAILAMIVHLDGSGAVTFLITIPAMLPLFDKLKMDRRVLVTVVALGAGTMNMVPWGGPTIRAATALGVDVTELYRPLLIPQLAGLIFVILVAWYLGKKEARRIAADQSPVFVNGATPFFSKRIVENTCRVFILVDPVQYRLITVGNIQVKYGRKKFKDGGLQIFHLATIPATLFTCKACSSLKREDMTVRLSA